MPSMLTSFAFSVRHESVVVWPGVTVSGFAESDAVGAAGGGGGGGGGAVSFFLHAPTTSSAAITNSSTYFFLVKGTQASIKCKTYLLVSPGFVNTPKTESSRR